MNKKIPSSQRFIRLFFFVPAILLLVVFLLASLMILPFEHVVIPIPYFDWYWLLIIFDIIFIIKLFRYHRELNLFSKIFLAVGLLLCTFYNYQYAILKQQGVILRSFTHPYETFPYIGTRRHDYYFSTGVFTGSAERIFPFAYDVLLLGTYIDTLAFMTGIPYILILLVLPSFLAVPFFWLWVGFSVFYIVTPYSVLKKISGRIKKIFKREESKS